MSNNQKYFDDLKDEIINCINNEVIKLAGKITQIVEGKTKQVIGGKIISSGNLQKSIESQIKKTAEGYMLRIFTNAPYGHYVDSGTRPHFPPVLLIREWVLKNNIAKKLSPVGKNIGRIKNLKRYSGSDGFNEVNKIAFLIARKISKKGTEGIKFFELALKQVIPQIENELKNYPFTTNIL